VSWSPQQSRALKGIAAWLADPKGKQVFRMFGFAGTGKTTLAKEIADDVEGEVLFMCLSGKASLVLRKKGCVGASTIHSAIYKPIEDPISGITTFALSPDSAVASAALVIVDEVSMVDEVLGQDLLSFGSRILVLGDPAQLPPVKGDGFFTNCEPDVMLTEVHRQAEGNPIIRMSMDVRQGRPLLPGTYGTSRIVRRADISKDSLRSAVLAADQMLCGRNATRQTFNARIRALKGLAGNEPWHPVKGDRLVCLKNNRIKGLLNGGLWDIERATLRDFGKKFDIRISSVDEPGMAHVDVSVPIEFFLGTEKEMEWRELKRADQFTYGWALTCHKAQGSQWDNVLVYDESSVFREDAAKWLYTAITRAAERVDVII
jgi:exodeoxyribonuclease-5